VLKNVNKPLQMLITDVAQYSYAGFSIMPRSATEVGVPAILGVELRQRVMYPTHSHADTQLFASSRELLFTKHRHSTQSS
jgi:hypothetical protein